MGKYCNFEQSSIWQAAHQSVIDVYNITKCFPKEETFALTSQVRRSIVSVEANIAEAFGRYHYLDKLNFYYNARGSLEESKSHLITAKDLFYISEDAYKAIRKKLEILGKELSIIIVALRSKKH